MRTGGKYQFKTAEDLQRAAQSYFDWCDTHPIIGAERNGWVHEYPRPYTFTGLCEYLNIKNWSLLVSKNKDREGFEFAFGHISNKIKANLIEGAMCGIYKENLVARIVGLPDEIAMTETPPVTVIIDTGEDEEQK